MKNKNGAQSSNIQNMDFLSETSTGVSLRLHIVPKASKTAINGIHGNALKLKVQAPPVDGKANKAIINFLSTLFSIPKRNIILKSGVSSRQKMFIIKGLNIEKAQKIVQDTL